MDIYISLFKSSKQITMLSKLYLLIFITVVNAVPLNISKIESFNGTCTPRDSCKASRNSRFGFDMEWKSRNCFCDNICADYGDCCRDASAYNVEEQNQGNENYQCQELRHYEGIYMKSECLDSWEDEEINNKCIMGSSTNVPDTMIYLPVTSKSSRVTYRNFYCAVCNNDSLNIELWNPRIECPSIPKDTELTKTFIEDNLMFKNDNWGIHLGAPSIFHKCYVDPYLPDTVADMVRPCLKTINTCPTNWTDDEVRHKCESYTGVVYENDKPYRNYHCAICNKVENDFLFCEKHTFTRFNFRNDFSRTAFSLLFDFVDKSGSDRVGISNNCNTNEIWDPFFKKCRNVVCGKADYEYQDGKCIPQINEENTTETPISTDKNEDESEGTTVETTISSVIQGNNDATSDKTGSKQPSLNCNRILLPDDEFERRENNTVFVTKYDKTYNNEEYENHEGGILVCTMTPDPAKFSSVMGYVTLFGLGISCICIIIHLIAFCFVPELRNLSGKNLTSLCLCLLSAYACFILGIFGEAGKLECFVLAALMYYFFLASFCWMNVMAFDIWNTLRLATSELRVSGGQQWRKFLIYSLYGWVLPAIAFIILITLDITKPMNIDSKYFPDFGQRWCWFGQRKALLVFFATPLSIIMLVNIVMFIMSAKIIAVTTRSTAKISSCGPYQSQFKLYMRLALLMGLTWIIGIVAGYLQLEIIWYLFILLNTLQGFFIFICFTCTKKVCRTLCGPCWRKIKVARYTSSTWPGRTSSASKKGLDSQESNTSHLSHSSMAQLTTNTSRSNVDTF